jgi:curved DNA-binding protein CbpA
MNIDRCFEILEIPPNATYEEAKAAYRIMCQVWHPDKYHHSEQLHAKASNKIKEINAAWSQIEDYFKNGFSREDESKGAERKAADQEKADKEKQSNRPKNESSGMIWDSEDGVFISVICPKCKKGSRIRKDNATKTVTGYSFDGKGTCSCGFAFDKVERNNTASKQNPNSFKQQFLQGISDHFNSPWWVVILPVIALSLLKACKG